MRGSDPSLENSEISRVGVVHRSGIGKSHALERSTARESRNLTRGSVLSLGDRRILRAGVVHRSRIAEPHA